MKVEVKTKGRVVLPVEVRRKLGLEPGVEMEVWTEGKKVILLPLVGDPITEAEGMFAGMGNATDGLLADRRREIEKEQRESAKFRRRRR